MPARVISRLTAAALAAALAAGCTVADLLPGQGNPPQLFTLTPKSSFAPDLPAVDWQLTVETPVAAESHATTRIALRHDAVTLEYFKNARWTERAPVMVQTLLVESFENTGKIVAVARKATDLRADYVLKTDLREFQAEYEEGGLPAAHVRINAKLVKMPQRTIIASHTAEYRVRAGGNTTLEVVYAFDDALGKTLKSIIEWALAVPK